MGRLEEAEEGVKALKKMVEESESESSYDDEWEVVQRTKRAKGKRASRSPPPIVVGPNLHDSTALSQFVSASTIFLHAVRDTLPNLSALPPSKTLPLVAFQLSPDARIALDHFLEDHPLPSFPQLPSLDLNLRARLGDGTNNAMLGAATLLARVSEELKGVQTVLTGLTGVGAVDIAMEEVYSNGSASPSSDAGSATSYMPSLSSAPQLSVLRDYFSSESERLSSSLTSLSMSLPTPSSVATESLAHLCEEASELSHLVMDATAKLLHAAAEKGMQGLLMYDDLPFDWRNNEHIHSGYRFIAIERWGALVKSCFQWHNETINIQSHLMGTISLVYLLVFLYPASPHAHPLVHPADTAIALLFIVAAIKCLLCSTIYHTLSGCSTHGWHRRAACVDYVGISGLIAASVMGMEYYGFYCRTNLAIFYMCCSAALGASGMILPWQPWFNQRKYKSWRITFFLGLAFSAMMPIGHMAILYGVVDTAKFFSPVLPSITAYLVGVSFYGNSFPECMAPGRWDTLFASHQLWHGAIVAAVWLHWRALNIWATGALGGDQLSCSI